MAIQHEGTKAWRLTPLESVLRYHTSLRTTRKVNPGLHVYSKTQLPSRYNPASFLSLWSQEHSLMNSYMLLSNTACSVSLGNRKDYFSNILNKSYGRIQIM